MPGSTLLRVITFGVVFSGLAIPAFSQSEEREHTTGYNAIIDNIDLLVDNYARFLARKYDLTEEQDEYTKYLLRERSYEFLDQHEGDLRSMVDRLFDVRTGGEMTPEELLEWGHQAGPIYESAKKLIIAGNDEWREILTPEQQNIHDEDLKLMYQSFETTEDQLERIASGEMTVEEFRSPKRGRRSSSRSTSKKTPPPLEKPEVGQTIPPPNRLGTPESEPRVKRPARRSADRSTEQYGTRVARPGTEKKSSKIQRPAARSDRSAGKGTTGKKGGKEFESAWEKYVREFIAKYKLNNEQTQKANTVLEDCEAQAKRYMIGRQEQIEKLDKQIKEQKKARDKKSKSKNLSQLNDKRKKMMEPIDRIFEQQLKPRLERLPTRAQRRAVEAAAKKKPSDKKGNKNLPRKKTKKSPSDKDD